MNDHAAAAAERELAAEMENEPTVSSRPRTKLSPEAEAEIESRRQANVLAATIAGLSWGKQMTPVVRRAFADYCARYDVDPITEMDNLGGQPYVNADWYKRKLGELIVRGIVKDYKLEHIQADPRLKRMMDDPTLPDDMRDTARRKWFYNQLKRIEQNAPEMAEAICICTIYLPNGTMAKGCKWAGGGTSVKQPRHGGGAAPNPIAEMNPTLSVESMSIRRALSQLLSHISGQRISGLMFPSVAEMESELDKLNVDVPVVVQEPVREAHAARSPAALMSGEGYPGMDADVLSRKIEESNRQRSTLGVMEPVRVNGEQVPALFQVAAQADPYGLDAPPAEEFVDGAKVATGPEPTATAEPDLFGGKAPVEPSGLDAVECEVCANMIRSGHPEDHDPACEGYVEP